MRLTGMSRGGVIMLLFTRCVFLSGTVWGIRVQRETKERQALPPSAHSPALPGTAFRILPPARVVGWGPWHRFCLGYTSASGWDSASKEMNVLNSLAWALAPSSGNQAAFSFLLTPPHGSLHLHVASWPLPALGPAWSCLPPPTHHLFIKCYLWPFLPVLTEQENWVTLAALVMIKKTFIQ